MPQLLNFEEYSSKMLSLPRPGAENILAFYEHRVGAVGRDPRLMLLPLDDHLTHRGDGVFEAVKYVDGRLYQLDKHLDRMKDSAGAIYLEPPCPWEEVRALILAVAAAGEERTGAIRILIGRGPGSFGIDPFESPVPSLYIVAHRFEQKPESWFEQGLKGFRTGIPAKQGYLARIKHTNYLPNMLMIREARVLGKDVPLCFDAEGYLAESATANICLVSSDGVIEVPEFTNALAGTTVKRALELVDGKVPHRMRRITEADISRASEVLMLSTGPDCVAVVDYEGQRIGSSRQGPVCALLRRLIREDIKNTGTPVPGLV